MNVPGHPPAAWYPDPSHPSDPRHQRWWDGARWTDHVAIDGVVGQAPLTPGAAPVAATVAVVPAARPKAGWHPDPADPRRVRWWDGSAWTEHVGLGGVVTRAPVDAGSGGHGIPEEILASAAAAQAGTAPTRSDRPGAGWHEDPIDHRRRRWWDGERWSAYVAHKGEVSESPLPMEGAAAAWAERQDQRAPWPGWVAGFAFGAALLSAVLAVAVVSAGDAAGFDSPTAGILLGSVGLYSGLVGACWFVHRRCRTGRTFWVDYGIAYRRGDWWRGLLGSLGARAAAVVIAVVLLLFSEDFEGSNTQGFEEIRINVGLVIAFAISALVLAPLIEELFFRGLLMRSLETVMPAWLAIAVQASLFGLAHTSADMGAANLTIVAVTGAGGAIFGIIARHHHRLGPSISAHAWFNLLPVVVLAVTGLT